MGSPTDRTAEAEQGGSASGALKAFTAGFVERAVEVAGGRTGYRRPLVGFASADDPAWARLRELADPGHLLPSDLLPGARTVAAWFVPFADEVVAAHRRARDVAPEWALAYTETNALLAEISGGLKGALAARGIRAAAEPPTHNFDPATLRCRWSHKSAAAVAGLGSFGLHRMLITDSGCAGRCGSLVLDAAVEPTRRDQRERCSWLRDGSCGACARACPTGALRAAAPGEENLDKARCYARLLEVEARLGADACGKCALGPCAQGPAPIP